MEAGGWILGTGTTSADFQIGGTNPSLIDELKMAASGWHRSELKSRPLFFGGLFNYFEICCML